MAFPKVVPGSLRIPLTALVVACAALTCVSAEEATPKKVMSADWPELATERSYHAFNEGPALSLFEEYWSANGSRFWDLIDYTPESVSSVLGERLKKENDVTMKLLLAVYASVYGNLEAKQYLEEFYDPDLENTESRLRALNHIIQMTDAPEWAFTAAHRALSDDRPVAKKNEPPAAASIVNRKVSTVASYVLMTGLGRAKNPASVPVLIEYARRTSSYGGAVSALGKIGDSRALPFCLELLHREDEAIRSGKANNNAPLSEVPRLRQRETIPSSGLLGALGDLKAKEAIPILLRYLHSQEVLDTLVAIGDPAAIQPLHEFIESRGLVYYDPGEDSGTPPAAYRYRVFTAEMALMKLEKGDHVPRLLEMLADPDFSGYRERLVAKLEEGRDIRIAPPLVAILKSDNDGDLLAVCIRALKGCRSKAAVLGLIEGFGREYPKHKYGKSGRDSDFPQEISDALRGLTGQNFGKDRAKWQAWWEATGQADPRFR